MGNLTIERDTQAYKHDNRFKQHHKRETIPKSKHARYYIDISSVAIRKQHNVRYMYIKRGIKLDIDFVCLYDTLRKEGYYKFIPHRTKKRDELRKIINDFVKKIGIDATQIFHDKTFLFGFGVSYCGVSLETQRHKQKIEHVFSFKRWVYREYKRGNIKTSKELFSIYRKYLNGRNLEEI